MLDHHHGGRPARRRRPRSPSSPPAVGSRRGRSAPSPRSLSAAFMRPWTRPTALAEELRQNARCRSSAAARSIASASSTSRADPVHLGALGQRAPHGGDDLLEPVASGIARVRPAGAPAASRSARETRGRHTASASACAGSASRSSPGVGAGALGARAPAAGRTPKRCCSSITASAEIVEGDLLLQQRVRADRDRALARRQGRPALVARRAALAPGQERRAQARRRTAASGSP